MKLTLQYHLQATHLLLIQLDDQEAVAVEDFQDQETLEIHLQQVHLKVILEEVHLDHQAEEICMVDQVAEELAGQAEVLGQILVEAVEQE